MWLQKLSDKEYNYSKAELTDGADWSTDGCPSSMIREEVKRAEGHRALSSKRQT
jgi:hypothetical protein